MSKYIQADQSQPYLLPPDLRDWLPEDDLAHFVLEAVERVPMNQFKVNDRGTGSAQYHPQMMLALLIYGYCNGVFSSRRLERATHRDIGFRFVTANLHPDHDTIAKFRRENVQAISECFVQVLLIAKELKLLRVGTVSVDGTKLDAHASKHRSLRHDRAQALREQLQQDIEGLLNQAEQADQHDTVDPQQLPEQLARRQTLKEQLDAACERLARKAKDRAQSEQGEYEDKLERREARHGRAKGKIPKAPDDQPRDREQTNLTDPDSALMRKNKQSEYRQAYNAQAVVDATGTNLIVGQRVSNNASDSNELVPDIDSVDPRVGSVKQVLADNGYANGEQISALGERGIDALVATGAGGGQRQYDFRPPKAHTSAPPATSKPWIVQMRGKMAEESNKALYRLRQQTVEPVFGIVKSVLGFRQFRVRGLNKVQNEWCLVSLAYNCKRLHKMMAQTR